MCRVATHEIFKQQEKIVKSSDTQLLEHRDTVFRAVRHNY